MTTVVNTAPGLTSRLVNGVLAIKPLANLAKHQARQMMIKRAEKIGVPWRKEVQALQARDWDAQLAQVQNPLAYPDYYCRSFHAYDHGNLSWEAAMEVEVAAYAVHAGIWPDAGAQGDPQLRQSYHDVLKAQLTKEPRDILDLGCSVGMSAFALQKVYPQAKITGLDLSPYFLAVAHYRSQQRGVQINWVHAAAESTGLPAGSFDLVSTCLMCHELPQSATRQIFHEARRLLRPGGYLAIMDMNPQSEIYGKMPPYILTLLKSTEPYLDEYFVLDIEQAIVDAGFTTPTITRNTPPPSHCDCVGIAIWVDDFQLAVWAVCPPLLLLVYYYYRISSAPSLPRLLLFFVVGGISGWVALVLQWGFEYLANWIVDWERITRSLPGIALRQLVEVGPIEEGSKLGGVVLLEWHRSRPKRPSTVFLYSIAVALGFAAEENWVYLFSGTASIFDRIIGTPVHALFSAPWGYALGVVNRYTHPATGYRGLIGLAWLNAVVCHALVNVLSSSWRYSLPLRFLSYGLFPFLLWMFWRMEQLWKRSQGKPPIVLISSHIGIHRYLQCGLALFALMLGGNAIFGFFLLVRSLSPLNPSQLFSSDVWWFIISRFVLNLIPGLLAWGIYQYLRR